MRRANPTAIGGFVLGAMMLALGAVLYFSSAAVLKERIELVTYFPGTVQGLHAGAAVEFRGVQVGQVTQIRLLYTASSGEAWIPVYLDIWPETIVFTDNADDLVGDDIGAIIEEQGLRARLQAASLVTGQFNVALDLLPDSEMRLIGADLSVREIPAVESTRDRIAGALETLDLEQLVARATQTLNAVHRLASEPRIYEILDNVRDATAELRDAARTVGARVEPLTEQTETTLRDVGALARTTDERVRVMAAAAEGTLNEIQRLGANLDQQVGPVARSAAGAFEEGTRAMREARELVSQDSATRQNLDTLLEEAAGAARSLRILADYLEQNPDALIKGR